MVQGGESLAKLVLVEELASLEFVIETSLVVRVAATGLLSTMVVIVPCGGGCHWFGQAVASTTVVANPAAAGVTRRKIAIAWALAPMWIAQLGTEVLQEVLHSAQSDSNNEG
ncbi:MAG: hypothetical protein SGPRY_004046 [Prymnesium sp.]